MWSFIGAATITHETAVVTLGKVATALSDRSLALRFGSGGPNRLRPLSFGIVLPVGATENDCLPSARHYPADTDQLVRVGPGIGDSFTGEIRYKVRNYNRKWMQIGMPAYSLLVGCWAWSSTPQPAPSYQASGFRGVLGGLFRIGAKRIGPSGAAPLTPHG